MEHTGACNRLLRWYEANVILMMLISDGDDDDGASDDDDASDASDDVAIGMGAFILVQRNNECNNECNNRYVDG
jgi:hypothetical protein